MIKIKYDKRNKNQVNKYKAIILKKRKEECIKALDSLCKKYIITHRKTYGFEDIIVAPPVEIKEIVEMIDSSPIKSKIRREFYSYSLSKKTIKLTKRTIKTYKINKTTKTKKSKATKAVKKFKEIKTSYILDTLYGKMKSEAKEIIFALAEVSVCPYCNRNFIESVKENVSNGKVLRTFQLDHFYDKATYPMLAVSFYNLVPTCGSCNLHKKQSRFDYYPYLGKKTDEVISFDFKISSDEFLEKKEVINVKVNSLDKTMESNIKELNLELLYNTHTEMVQEIIKKAYYYGDFYIDSIVKSTDYMFKSREEAYRILYGNYYEDENYGKRPLAKFTKDIFHEVNKCYNPKLDEYIRELVKKKGK